jgi:hypothetical protein
MIEISMQLRSAQELFDGFDPSPAENRRLSDAAASYLLASLREAGGSGPVVVSLRVGEAAESHATEMALRAAIPAHFRRLANVATAEVRRIRVLGRVFVPLGFVIMGLCLFVSELLTSGSERPARRSLAEGILVLGWVALWAPFDHLLFGRLPVLRDRACYRRLADARVTINYLQVEVTAS